MPKPSTKRPTSTMPCPPLRNRIVAIIIGKVIFATKYLGVLLSVLLILQARSHAADEAVSAPPPPPPAARLALTDCIKCHPGIVSALEADGMAHRDKLTCQKCHVGHPPRDKEVIPLCSRCHQGIAHFGLNNCLQCHTNPHTPLKITLTRDITAPCTTCHNGQLEQLQENQSIHSTLDCTACHTSHGYRPPCFNCHAPHLEGMANKTCQLCHQPHMPLVVSFPPDTPSEYCGPCHPEVYALLGASRAKHRNVLCAQCHAGKHKTIPACQKCHAAPHSQSIIGQFGSCGKCHGIAHDLKLNKIDIRLENRPQ